MESQRFLLFIGLLLVSVMLYQSWLQDYGPKPPQEIAKELSDVAEFAAEYDIPQNANTGSDIPGVAQSTTQARLIWVTTDTLKVAIDRLGGDIVRAELLKYPLVQGHEEPVVILEKKPGHRYIAQSGLIGADGPDSDRAGRPLYNVAQENFVLEGNELSVDLRFVSQDGLHINKVFRFKRDSYRIDVDYELKNQAARSMIMQSYNQLKQTIKASDSSLMMPTYRGPAYSTADERYKKFEFEDLQDKDLNKATQGGWVAMLQHYFVSAWVPSAEAQNKLYSRDLNGDGIIGVKGPVIELEANQATTLHNTLYVGPKHQDVLSAISPSLNLVVDYGWLWFIAQPLHWLLITLQGFVINWGLAIIGITIVVRGSMYPLTKKQYESMGKMRLLQPKMKALQERYGEDRQKLQQATMELYKEEGANPLGGCLPILLQMPIFIALYWVLMESVELRHAEFALWITDLSVKDPYYVLPLLMGASMFLIQKMSPTTVSDPMQKKMMMLMPVIFTFMFLSFPSGLVLYWLVSNLISIVQQTLINKSLEKKGLGHK